MKLNVGCGKTHILGYVNIDLITEADVKADMLHLPYANESVDEIYCCHALEHLSFSDSKLALKEFRRVLKQGGDLRIVIPNMTWVVSAWLNGGDRGYKSQILFGNQEHEGEFHKNGWSKNDIIEDVTEAGFKVTDCVERWTPEFSQESIILEAKK